MLVYFNIILQLSRERKNLEDKLQETHATLEQEENKAKQEHRQRVKLEQIIAELQEKLEREIKVCAYLDQVKPD